MVNVFVAMIFLDLVRKLVIIEYSIINKRIEYI